MNAQDCYSVIYFYFLKIFRKPQLLFHPGIEMKHKLMLEHHYLVTSLYQFFITAKKSSLCSLPYHLRQHMITVAMIRRDKNNTSSDSFPANITNCNAAYLADHPLLQLEDSFLINPQINNTINLVSCFAINAMLHELHLPYLHSPTSCSSPLN